MRRLACLIQDLSEGGAERQLCNVAVGLGRRGWDVRFVTYAPANFYAPLLDGARITRVELKAGSRWERFKAVREYLRRGDQDAVLSFMPGASTWAVLAGLPRRDWALIASERIALERREREIWRARLYRHADIVTTNSHANRLILENLDPALAGRVITVYNGVALDHFSRGVAAPAPSPAELRLVAAATVVAKKNPVNLIEALALARRMRPGVRVTLDWYGLVPAYDRSAFESAAGRVAELGLGELVRFHDAERDIAERYRAADALVHPSCFEGLPNSVCEAMACGLPVLSSDVCDAGNLVEPGGNGYLFDPGRPEDIAEAIVRLADAPPGRRAEMGRRSRALAETLFAPEKFVDKYAEIVEAAIGRRGASGISHWPARVPGSAVAFLRGGAGKPARLSSAWKTPGARALASRRPVVLMYHGVPRRGAPGEIDAESFERQMALLKNDFEVVAGGRLTERRGAFDKIRVILTFDDGFRNNAEVVAPILRRHGLPALFFVSSRHAEPGKYLWFAYLRALERSFPGARVDFRGEVFDLSPAARSSSVRRLRERLLALEPHPAAMYDAIEKELPPLESFLGRDELADAFAGMTAEQIADMSQDGLFEFGVHTVDHPYLTRCEPGAARRQIEENRRWIAQATGKPCRLIAYPLGTYDRRILDIARELGFAAGYSVGRSQAGAGAPADPVLAAPRVGIYSPSLDKLAFKAHWGNLLRRTPLRMG